MFQEDKKIITPTLHEEADRSFVRVGLDACCLLIVTLAALGVYWITIGPTVTGEDSGELISAAYTLGIAHPPGYPLWCLLGKAFSLVPLNSVAWRVAFMSAFFGMGAAVLSALLVLKTSGNRMAAIIAGLAIAFSAEFWEQSVIAEVYSLNAFLIILYITILLRWKETGRRCLLYVFALVYGLGLGNHNTVHLLGPFFALFILFVDRKPWVYWRSYLAMSMISLVAWAVIHAYLPVRSLANPPIDWGNPETWQSFWDVITRHQYKATDGSAKPESIVRYTAQLGSFMKLYTGEFTLWFSWLPFVGLWFLFRRDKHVFLLVSLVLFAGTLVLLWVLNFTPNKQALWINNVFMIPAYMLGGICVGFAIDGLTARIHSYWARAIIQCAFGMAIVATLLYSNWQRNDKSHYFIARDYAENILKTLPENALYFPGADHATFPLLYLQNVEGIRRDVTVGNKYGYPEESLYKDIPEIAGIANGHLPNRLEQRSIEDAIIARTDRPVFFSAHRDMSGLPGYKLQNEGLLFRVVRPDEEFKEAPGIWEKYVWHSLKAEDFSSELTADFILADYHFMRGMDYLAKGNTKEGLTAFESVAKRCGDGAEAFNNLGSACADHGLLPEAESYYLRAVELDSEYLVAVHNLGKLYYGQQRFREALLQFETIFRKEHSHAEAVWLSSLCMIRIGWQQDAFDRLQYLLQISPRHAGAHRELGFLCETWKLDKAQADFHYRESLRLDPQQTDLKSRLGGLTPDPTDGPDLMQPNRNNLAPAIPSAPIPGIPGSGAGMPGIPSIPTPTSVTNVR